MLKQEPAGAESSDSARLSPVDRAKGTRSDPYTGLLVDQRYAVESLLAEGGMGRVYRCRHSILDKKLAIKIIRSDVAQQPDSAQRFLIEAKAASAIGNEHIIDIIDFGALPDGAAYLVMEFLEGAPLSSLVCPGRPLDARRIAAITLQIAEGLSAAHAAGIVHRDLKPDNVILLERKGEDFVKILDFGVAQMALAPGSKVTRAGTIVGTPCYMSPEQCAAGALDHRSDIYALGVIMYELASGRLPFDGQHYLAVLHQHVNDPPPAFASLTPPVDMPRELERIIFKCLAKLPEQRYASMAQLMRDVAPLARKQSAPLEVTEAAPTGQGGSPEGAGHESPVSAALAAPPVTTAVLAVPDAPAIARTFALHERAVPTKNSPRLYLAILGLGAVIAAWGLRGLSSAEPSASSTANATPRSAVERSVTDPLASAAAPAPPDSAAPVVRPIHASEAALEPAPAVEVPEPGAGRRAAARGAEALTPTRAEGASAPGGAETSTAPSAAQAVAEGSAPAPAVEARTAPAIAEASTAAPAPSRAPAPEPRNQRTSKSSSTPPRSAPAVKPPRGEFINPWPER